MGAAARKTDGEVMSAINVTPFVDIVLVLLIILMVTSVQIIKASLEVDLPRAASGGAAVESTLNIVVDKDGSWKIDGKPITKEALQARVVREVAANPKIQAVIAGDRQVQYESIVDAIDLVKLNGVKKFALNIQRKLGTGDGTTGK